MRPTVVYAIRDDHDFGTNDCVSNLPLDDPPWKLDVLGVFRQNWVNPAYGQGPERPGCYFRFTIGNVDFFMLDCRFYRTPPDAAGDLRRATAFGSTSAYNDPSRYATLRVLEWRTT